MADHAVFAGDEFAYGGRGEVEVGHVADAPPTGVAAVGVETVRVAPRGVLARPCTRLGVGAVAVEVDGIVARMVEHAVEDDGYAARLGFAAEFAEILLGAEHRVDLEVVGRVVSMVARRREDGVQVEHGEAHLGEAVEVGRDALERAPVHVPARDGAVLVAVVDGWFIPIPPRCAAARPWWGARRAPVRSARATRGRAGSGRGRSGRPCPVRTRWDEACGAGRR